MTWTRLLTLYLGHTTAAASAVVAAFLGGLAIGAAAGGRAASSWTPRRCLQAYIALEIAVVICALLLPIELSLFTPALRSAYDNGAGGAWFEFIRIVSCIFMVMVPAIALGATFPMAIRWFARASSEPAKESSRLYFVNTVGAAIGSMLAGFVLIPSIGMRATIYVAMAGTTIAALCVLAVLMTDRTEGTSPPTLWIVSGCLIACAAVLIFSGAVTGTSRVAGLVTAAVAIVLVVTSPGWDRELLASGAYMYAPYVPKDLDLETQLKAGELLYYKEGAAATVSVKRLTGTTTLAVDGKTDASNRGDMLTQKLIAHIPLMLHREPKQVFILGLGSGMTVGAALTHPIERADVVEISPEVVEASAFFKNENRNALADPRTNLIIGDGRSHLALSDRKYDVIVSEPSNPWIAGVSSLFTKEFFESARERLAPGGVICQWVNAYNISDADLKSVVATFNSVYPYATVWLVGTNDVLMLATTDERAPEMARVADRMKRTEVSADLTSIRALDPGSITSLMIGRPQDLAAYTAGAPIFTDDRLTLEFTAPREIHRRRAGDGPAIRPLFSSGHAVAGLFRNRAAMLFGADHFQVAMEDFERAIEEDPSDSAALEGLVKTALILKKPAQALKAIGNADSADAMVARSKLLAADDRRDDAIAIAREAAAKSPLGVAQLASLYADAGDTVPLDNAVAELRKTAPNQASTEYYAAAAAFLHGDATTAVANARRAIAIDPNYAPTYDLIGAAYTKLGQLDLAREAFQKSLSFDAHDSTAYENLGVLELNAGNRAQAAKYFAEALWLVPESDVSREGLRRARTGSR
ncbi:MAG: fused MFS/spermidine synthase [Cyanobacteria bacterium]|nr:fused MFS/spermidine synthase [Cyanobacteriota bacterium]